MPELESNVLSLIVVVMMLGFLPFVAVGVTAFAKITVVLLIVRNALGVQQTPPNMVLYGVALVLTVYIAAPLAADIQTIATDPRPTRGNSLKLHKPRHRLNIRGDTISPIELLISGTASQKMW